MNPFLATATRGFVFFVVGMSAIESDNSENKKPLTLQGFFLEVKSGFEPLYEVLQTSA